MAQYRPPISEDRLGLRNTQEQRRKDIGSAWSQEEEDLHLLGWKLKNSKIPRTSKERPPHGLDSSAESVDSLQEIDPRKRTSIEEVYWLIHSWERKLCYKLFRPLPR